MLPQIMTDPAHFIHMGGQAVKLFLLCLKAPVGIFQFFLQLRPGAGDFQDLKRHKRDIAGAEQHEITGNKKLPGGVRIYVSHRTVKHAEQCGKQRDFPKILPHGFIIDFECISNGMAEKMEQERTGYQIDHYTRSIIYKIRMLIGKVPEELAFNIIRIS